MRDPLSSPVPGGQARSPVALTQLHPGSVAELDQVRDAQSRAVLSSLGLTGGSRLRLCRLGDPCIIQVRSTRIGLSKVVADWVFVVGAHDEPR